MEKFANNANTTLAAAISSTGATTLVVVSTATFPSTGIFRILIDTELLTVTGVSGTTWTVTRGAEGTVAATHLNGSAVVHILTAASIIQAITERVADAVASMTAQDTVTFADATARAAATPVYVGQLGVQLSDHTLWHASGTSAGNWTAVA